MIKMKRVLLLLVVFFICTSPVFAEEIAPTNRSLRANFKRVSIDFSNTKVKNGNNYKETSVSALSASDEFLLKGVFDFALEYERRRIRWDNKIFAEYGKSEITELDGVKTKTETADEILLTSDLTSKLWKYGVADVGPFASIGYQTEFTRNDDAPLTKIARGKLGIKLINGIYFSELYVANVFDVDFTYNRTIEKYGLEAGASAKYNLREGVDFKFDGYYRDYLAYSSYNYNDLSYDLNFTLRMDVNVVKILNVSPFISWRQAKSRGASSYARNTNIGISALYTQVFNIL